MITFRVKTKNLEETIRAVQEFQRRLEDRSKPLGEIKELQASRWQRNFTSGGGEYERFAAAVLGPTPLNRSMGTYGVFSGQTKRGKVSASKIEWEFRNQRGSLNGRSRWYSPVSHDAGYSLRGAKVPARAIILLDEKDEQVTEDKLVEWIIDLENELF